MRVKSSVSADPLDGPRRLRELIERPGLVLAPGVANAFHAKIAEKAGFDAIFVTAAGIANTGLGVPDLGLTTMTEVVTATARITESVAVPVIADADTGYGNHLNVMRTVAEFERAGVSGLFIEDQVAPKRCGHFEGKGVVPVKEMVQKLVAATMARRNPDLLLIARTDAIAVEGLESAIERARAYLAAGADMIFVEAPRSEAEMRAISRDVAAPCLVNLVEGGLTPILPADRLEAMGFKLAIYANLALRMAAQAVDRAFRTLRAEGTSVSLINDMYSWEERQELVGLSRWGAVDHRVEEAAQEVMRSVRRERR